MYTEVCRKVGYILSTFCIHLVKLTYTKCIQNFCVGVTEVKHYINRQCLGLLVKQSLISSHTKFQTGAISF